MPNQSHQKYVSDLHGVVVFHLGGLHEICWEKARMELVGSSSSITLQALKGTFNWAPAVNRQPSFRRDDS